MTLCTAPACATIAANAVDMANTLFDSLVAHPIVAEDAVRIAEAMAHAPQVQPQAIADLCALLEQGPDVFTADQMATIQEAKFLADIASDFANVA